MTRTALREACGDDKDEADMLMVASSGGAGAAVAAIRAARPDLVPVTNEQIVARMQTQGFTYFRQISAVLSTITLLFGFLLITVLLTVSVNQRLAEHYGIPGIYGTTFRKVKLDPALRRGGLLGQASILTVTSYNNRTSVVLRGKWILENILAAPPPPPPPDIPALNDAKNGKLLSVREQMEMHRANPICASCHTKMDPLGFSLENYDAVGAWRASFAG